MGRAGGEDRGGVSEARRKPEPPAIPPLCAPLECRAGTPQLHAAPPFGRLRMPHSMQGFEAEKNIYKKAFSESSEGGSWLYLMSENENGYFLCWSCVG